MRFLAEGPKKLPPALVEFAKSKKSKGPWDWTAQDDGDEYVYGEHAEDDSEGAAISQYSVGRFINAEQGDQEDDDSTDDDNDDDGSDAQGDKFRKERDFHRMHHRRVVQEKNRLIIDLKRLKRHYEQYEPTLTELRHKYEVAMKEKMLMSLERDRYSSKAESP